MPVADRAGTTIWHFCHVLAGSSIGRNCSIGQNVMIGPKRDRRRRLQDPEQRQPLRRRRARGRRVLRPELCLHQCGQSARASCRANPSSSTTLVRRGATIGANATIVCGHTIGAYAFIAAGAVVTSDVPEFALMAGVPARRMGWMSRAGERLGPISCARATARATSKPRQAHWKWLKDSLGHSRKEIDGDRRRRVDRLPYRRSTAWRRHRRDHHL